MKASLQLRMSQQLMLTPQLQQSIKLLQLSTQDMQQEVARMLDENPMLEVSDEASYFLPANQTKSSESSTEKTSDNHQDDQRSDSSDANETDVFEWNTGARGSDDENESFPEQAALQASMREYLHRQLSVSQLDNHDKRVVGMLIDALDENGYMAQDLDELADLLPTELGITLDDLETALVQLQYLDRPGLAARNLSECLVLQLKALPESTMHRDLAISLVKDHIELLAAHDYTKIKKLLHCTDEGLRVAHQLITNLDPKPGCAFDHSIADYVVPDVVVEKYKGKWRATLNSDAMPKLRVNQLYANILQQRDDKSGAPLFAQLQEASWLIKSLKQRFDTILRVAQVIVDRQGAFLDHGDIAMRPMVLREIADELQMHESTVSRSTTQKFMRTPRGIYEFKYFFGSGLLTESGGVCSSAAIRELIKQLVNGEDSCKPLTDGRMSEILAQQGIVIARRTIAKYREALHILPVNLRKSL
jgi:RNA polymerase sigma-54 factor